MDTELKVNERIDDLQRNAYRIIQNKSRFCFGMDAVLLSGFAFEGERNRQPAMMADLGTGTGIIPLLMYGRLHPRSMDDDGSEGSVGNNKGNSPAGNAEGNDDSCPDVKAEGVGDSCPAGSAENNAGDRIIGLEIQEEVCDMARRSVQLNDLEQHIQILQADIKEASALLGKGIFDAVTSNPPYMRHGKGLANPDDSKAISRHEILCNFDDVAREASSLLKEGGRFYLVHRPERLAELIVTLRKYRLEPKRLRMVHSFADTEATMLLIESHKGGGQFMKVEKPLVIYKEKGLYTDEIRQIYYY